MANTSQYRLHAKYENIPLAFGSPILVNNGNITEEYAQKLLQHKNGERYFAQMPEQETPKVKKAKRKRIAPIATAEIIDQDSTAVPQTDNLSNSQAE